MQLQAAGVRGWCGRHLAWSACDVYRLAPRPSWEGMCIFKLQVWEGSGGTWVGDKQGVLRGRPLAGCRPQRVSISRPYQQEKLHGVMPS